MIDRKKFNENFQFFEKDIIIEIINIFESEYDERYTNLRKNVSERNFDQLKFNAHSLKGVLANFMDPITIGLSQKLDEMAKKREETGLSQVFEELVTASEALSKELAAIKSELTA